MLVLVLQSVLYVGYYVFATLKVQLLYNYISLTYLGI